MLNVVHFKWGMLKIFPCSGIKSNAVIKQEWNNHFPLSNTTFFSRQVSRLSQAPWASTHRAARSPLAAMRPSMAPCWVSPTRPDLTAAQQTSATPSSSVAPHPPRWHSLPPLAQLSWPPCGVACCNMLLLAAPETLSFFFTTINSTTSFCKTKHTIE